MTMTEGAPADELSRTLRRYQMLLVLYPRSFREEYGEQMVQVFEDLAVSTHRGGDAVRRDLWGRVLRDLVVSAPRERGAALLGPGGRGPLSFVAVAGLVALLVAGRPGSWVLLLLPFLLTAPTAGVVLLRRALLVRRTTGAKVSREVGTGLFLLVPTPAFLVAVGPDRGWYVVMTIIFGLVCGCAGAGAWAVSILWAGRTRTEDEPNRRGRAVVVLVGGVVILGGMAAAGYNSYRNSRPPAGDHSVARASADTRALWEAAWTGDVIETERLVASCADPFVHFSGHGQEDRRARSVADWQAGGWGNSHPVAEIERPRFRRVVAILQEAEDMWPARCGPR